MINIPNNNFISDEQLLTLLDAKEAGKSFPDALAQTGVGALSQEDTASLRVIWNMHGTLMNEAHNISPSRALLSRIIEGVEISASNIVTNSPVAGYNEHRTEGQFLNSNNNVKTFMQINWKIVAPIAVFVIVVVAGMSMGQKDEKSLAVNNQPTSVVTPTSVEPTGAMMAMKATPSAGASGNVDDLVSALSFEADGDKTLLDDSSADIALVTADNQTITDFNTTYNETTF